MLKRSILSEISHPGESNSGRGERVVHLAVVSANDGVVEVLCDWTSEGLLIRLSRYVEENAVGKLWSKDSRRMRELLEAGNPEAAIELYFEKVGERWDSERLHREAVHLPLRAFLEWTDR